MASQRVIFEGESFLRLLTAYFEGEVPLDAKLLRVGYSGVLGSWIGFMVESEQWEEGNDLPNGHGMYPLHLRYDHRRNMSWSKNDNEPITWGEEGRDFEVPK